MRLGDGCPCCGARWYGYLTFCWCCDWVRGNPLKRATAEQKAEAKADREQVNE